MTRFDLKVMLGAFITAILLLFVAKSHAVTKCYDVSWVAPTERQDSTPLPVEEILHFEVHYGIETLDTYITAPSSPVEVCFDAPEGTHTFITGVVTVDINNVRGSMSATDSDEFTIENVISSSPPRKATNVQATEK